MKDLVTYYEATQCCTGYIIPIYRFITDLCRVLVAILPTIAGGVVRRANKARFPNLQDVKKDCWRRHDGKWLLRRSDYTYKGSAPRLLASKTDINST